VIVLKIKQDFEEFFNKFDTIVLELIKNDTKNEIELKSAIDFIC
jgi:hypothetical protein